LFVAAQWFNNHEMFSLKRSIVAAALTGVSVALIAGCKTSETKPEPAKPATPSVSQTNPPPSAPVKPLPDSGDSMAPNILAWDSLSKDYHAKPGEMSAPFSFSLTNVSTKPIVIYDTSTSCDCTVASLPSSPWTIPSGGSGTIEASINLTNKVGIVTNSVIVYTSKGNRRLYVKAFVADTK
jgi:Protein of unknown function (DUF1573)